MTEQQLGVWLRALKSGKYVQFQKNLVNDGGTRHCCLGVLADIYNCRQKYTNSLMYPSHIITGEQENMCVFLNDLPGHAYYYAKVIADLESAPEWYITKR
jgi:hypothetical protein